MSCRACFQELFRLRCFHFFVFLPCFMPTQESPLSLRVSSFPLHVDASIGYIFFICLYGCCSFASFSMFGLCCTKASSSHNCNFIYICSLQNVIKPKINSLRCFVFGSLKNMIEHVINSSKCFLFVLRKTMELAINSSKYFVFGFLQNTTYHAINSCLLLPKHDQTRNHFLQILCVCSSPNYP